MEQHMLDKFKNTGFVEGPIDTERRLRVGIVGTGWMAEEYIGPFLKSPDVDLVAVSEIVPGKAEAFLKQMEIADRGIHIYSTAKEMYENENLDVVSICTYNAAHADNAVEALEHGVNVLCEKPMCVTLEEAIRMVRAEKASGKKLGIGFQPRMSMYMQSIKEVVQSGVLGDIYYIQSGGGRRHGIPTPYGTSFIEARTAGAGALADIGCYSLDMLMNAVGYPKPLTVSAYKSDFFGKDPNFYPGHPEYAEKFTVDDFAAAFVRLEGGIVLDFHISWAMHMDTTGDAFILGKKGGLKIPSTECWNGAGNGPLRIFHDVAGRQVETALPFVEEDFTNLLYRKIRGYLNAIKDGVEVPAPASQIIYNQAIIDGIIRSANLGREVEIEIPEF